MSVLGTPLDLAKCSIAPRVVNVQPPSLFTQTAFPKKLDVTGNFQINDKLINTGTAATQEQVSTQSGIMIWYPCRGANSLYRMGIVRSGKSSAIQTLPFNWFSGQIRFNYLGQTPVPYSATTAPLDVVKISPDLSQQFSQVRVYAGDVRMICDTVPIGNTALNGYFSAGAFSDSRDVCLVNAGGSGSAANSSTFGPADLVQASVTSKDGLKEVNVMKGIVSVIGSDIAPFYKPPLTDECDEMSAGWAVFDCDKYVSYTVGPLPCFDEGSTTTVTSTVDWNYLSVWVTPWSTSVEYTRQNPATSASPFTALSTIQTDPINLCGVLDIDLVASIKGNNKPNILHLPGAAPSYYPVDQQVRVLTFPVFVTCSAGPTYNCTYKIFTESKTQVLPWRNDAGDMAFAPLAPPNTLTGPQIMFVNHSSRPKMCQQGGLAETGMYLGTLVYVMLSNLGNINSNNGGFGSAGPTDGAPAGNDVNSARFNPHLELRVRARSLYNIGEIGPVRVIRWDGLSDDQQIKLDGVFNAQCIPEGNLAPFVTDLAMYSDTAHNVNSIIFLAELYNGDSPFKRNWTADEYDMFMRTMFPKLTYESVMGWSQPKLKSIAESAYSQSATKFARALQAGGHFGALGVHRGKSKSKSRRKSHSRRRSTSRHTAVMAGPSCATKKRSRSRSHSAKRRHSKPRSRSASGGRKHKSRSRSHSSKRRHVRRRSRSTGSTGGFKSHGAGQFKSFGSAGQFKSRSRSSSKTKHHRKASPTASKTTVVAARRKSRSRSKSSSKGRRHSHVKRK